MALTATATPATRASIMASLCMDKDSTTIVEKLPNKTNIRYKVEKKPKEIADILHPVIADIKARGKEATKTVVFCRTYSDYTELMTVLVNELHGQDCLYVAMDDGEKVAVCNMFSASTAESVKNEILTSFVDPSGPLRVVVATIAFGMGLDAPNIYRCIHYGPSESIEAYLQETGRCGRDGCESLAVLYFSCKDVSASSDVQDSMRGYCGNIGYCRRKFLMREFSPSSDIECPLPPHNCCDICERECNCEDCCGRISSEQSPAAKQLRVEVSSQPVSTDKQLRLEQALLKYRDSQCHVLNEQGQPMPILFGDEIVTQLPDTVLRALITNCLSLKSFSDAMDLGVTCDKQAREIFDIVHAIVNEQ